MANVIKHKRGSGSDPVANDLVVGEVAIRTDVGKLFTKMDNGSVAEIAGGGSDIAINTLSSSSATGGGSATFNGSAYRFTLSAPPSVSAQQLLVSINGVIQKPVAGTGQPSEGFSVDGTDIILGDAPATGSDFFILTFKSLGVSEPADNSVTSAKIADGAIVNADINASAAIAGTKISPDFGSQDVVTTGNITSGGTLKTTGNVLTVEGATPRLNLTDTNNNSDFEIGNTNGTLNIADSTNSVNRLRVLSNGTVIVTGNLDAEGGLDVTGAITGTGDLTIDTNTLHVDSSNNRVGIGTTSPSELLQVAGTLECNNIKFLTANKFETSPNILEGKGTNGARLRSALSGATTPSFSNSDDTDTGMFLPGSNVLGLTTGGSERLRIDSSGNVGIGTTSPETLLHAKINTFSDDINKVALTLSNAQSSGVHQYFQNGSTGTGVSNGARIGLGNTDNFLIQQFEAKDIQISTNSTERMRIDSSGNLLIGTSLARTPLGITTRLQVEGTDAGTSSFSLTRNSANIHPPFLIFNKSRGSSVGSDTVVQNGDSLGKITWLGNDGVNSDHEAAFILASVDATPGSNEIPGNLTFGTTSDGAASPTERMRIDSSGAVRIANTSFTADTSADDLIVGSTTSGINRGITILNHTGQDGRLCFAQSGDTDAGMIKYSHGSDVMQFFVESTEMLRLYGDVLRVGNSLGSAAAGRLQVVEERGGNRTNDCNVYFETNANDWNLKTYYNSAGVHYHIAFIEQGTMRGRIQGNDGSDVSYLGGSDYRWKENIVDMTGTEGIEICKKLKPRKYNWIENREVTGEINTVDGFIAHEVVEAGVLGAVTGEKDAVNEDGSIDGQMLSYGKITPVLAAAIKGLIARIEALEAK